jgi:hypothetical protein
MNHHWSVCDPLQLLSQLTIDHETWYERCVDGGYPNAMVFNFLLSVITACEMDFALVVHEMLYRSRTPRNSQLFLRQLFLIQELRVHMKIFFCFQPDDGI